MRGGLLHNHLVELLADAARGAGLWASTEAYLGPGYGDLVVGDGDSLILIEVETEARRVVRDLEKAERLGADELWIVPVDASRAGPMRDRAARHRTGTRVLVLPFPAAKARLSQIGGIHDRDE